MTYKIPKERRINNMVYTTGSPGPAAMARGMIYDTGSGMVYDTGSPEPPATAQGLTAQSTATSHSTKHSKAAPPNTMASSVQNSFRERADEVRRSSRGVQGTFRDPGIHHPPDHNGRRPGAHIRLLTRLKEEMKDDEENTVKAVLHDLQGSIRKSIQEHSHRSLWTFLEQHEEEIIESLRAGHDPLVRAELRRVLEPEIRAQVEAEFAGQREQKLAELAELDAEIERKRSAGSMAPPVTTQSEQGDQSSRPVRIKREPNDEPLSLFLDWEEDSHQNGENRGNNQEIEQEDVDHSGATDDTIIPWPFPPDDNDEPLDLPEVNLVPSIDEEGDYAPRNYSDTESDDSLGEDSDIEHMTRILNRIKSGKGPNYSQQDLIRDLMSGRSPDPTNSSCQEDEDFFRDREPFGEIPRFEASDSSTSYNRQEDDNFSDQDHLWTEPIFGESGESSNFSRQEGDSYNGQSDRSSSTLGAPIETDSLFSADDANDELPISKARRSNAARGTKRKGETLSYDPAYHYWVEDGRSKRVKINDTGLFPAAVFRATDDEKEVDETQRTVSTRKTDDVQAGRVKRSMPKKRGLSRESPIVIKDEEEDEEL